MVDYLIGVEFGQIGGDGFLDLGTGAFIQGIQEGAAYLAAGGKVTRLGYDAAWIRSGPRCDVRQAR